MENEKFCFLMACPFVAEGMAKGGTLAFASVWTVLAFICMWPARKD